MNRKILSVLAVVAGLFALNLVVSAHCERREAFASALKKLRTEKRQTSIAKERASETFVRTAFVGTPVRLTFNDLREYRFSRRANNPIPEKLKALEGKEVSIAGYMIPMSEALDVTEFMLVQIPFFGCCYSVPPEPNETVMVKMQKGKSTPYVYSPIRVTGTFKIQETKIDGFVVSVYEIEASHVKEADPNDKDVIQHQAGTPTPMR
ncbi:MAG: DUF3299 domain-containing protein [Chloroherpetonaceae bacterium]|nr:DUF3299 domain-containing protein [Chloroherpetonaceae bacterium]MDW8436904.1 DUF3299 domain-containing protein [Chloroherpetonaceae bacterium]